MLDWIGLDWIGLDWNAYLCFYSYFTFFVLYFCSSFTFATVCCIPLCYVPLSTPFSRFYIATFPFFSESYLDNCF